jgi:hypothetical protein
VLRADEVARGRRRAAGPEAIAARAARWPVASREAPAQVPSAKLASAPEHIASSFTPGIEAEGPVPAWY